MKVETGGQEEIGHSFFRREISTRTTDSVEAARETAREAGMKDQTNHPKRKDARTRGDIEPTQLLLEKGFPLAQERSETAKTEFQLRQEHGETVKIIDSQNQRRVLDQYQSPMLTPVQT